MARNKHPYKYVSEDQLQEYTHYDENQVLVALKRYTNNYRQAVSVKKNSEYLKDLKKEINDFRKVNTTTELEQAKDVVKDMEEERDERIAADLEEKKDLEAGLNDAIKANQEHRHILLDILSRM